MTAGEIPGQVRRGLPLDLGLGLLLVVWTAEATVRLPGGSLLTAVVYAVLVARLLLTSRLSIPAVLHGWPMLLYPAVCAVSVLWSPVPEESLIAALQLAVTVLAGIYVGTAFGLAGLAGLVLTGLGLTMAASVLNLGGALPPAWSWEGGFLGIYTNKNALGQRAVLLSLTLLLFMTEARGRARWIYALALAATGALLLLSRSATSWVVVLAAGGAMAFLLIRAARARVGLAVVALTGVLALAASLLILRIDPMQGLLVALGKSSTLTGRTDVWQAALAQIAERPLLGAGHQAFWTAPDHAREARLLAALYGDTVASFHNFVLEILVATGPLGLAAMAVLLGHVWASLRRVPPGPVRLWALTVFAVLVVLSLLGSSLYRAHEITLFLIVALGAAAASETRELPRPPDAR